jgi:N-acyl-D-aspartate/D-glutamate deacylase
MRFLLWLLPSLLAAQTYDVVLQGGRLLDPESGLDGVRNVGITGKKVAALSTQPLRGRIEIDATGLVVVPGFIDLHSHGQDSENYRYKAMDGVTTALELEVGVSCQRFGSRFFTCFWCWRTTGDAFSTSA